ncbi:hypothetical protein [Fimbriiglobus ruber]|uniref:hypothetical protein n=1 Tax=Fimbriiglobus ruber TaxID=1908690 RepID=UPI000B4C0DF3|nr:hypothetical protein [Fimbriiglobus ruber]
MTSSNDFLQQVEHEIRTARMVSDPTCRNFVDLPPSTFTAYARTMQFLGCESVEVPSGNTSSTPEPDRIRASRLMLLSLYADTSTPAWSSWMLDRLLQAVMGNPGGSVGDLLHALYGVLGEFANQLTKTMGNLIETLVIKCYTEYRSSYKATDLGWMVVLTTRGSTSAQAYLTLVAVPPTTISPECSMAILRSLESTPYWEQALNMLSDDLAGEKARELLQNWRAEGMAPQSAADLERVLGQADTTPGPA